MQRKKCSLCGKWEITDKVVRSSCGQDYCSECYQKYTVTIEYPENGLITIEGGNCVENIDFVCFNCPKVVECVKSQIPGYNVLTIENTPGFSSEELVIMNTEVDTLMADWVSGRTQRTDLRRDYYPPKIKWAQSTVIERHLKARI